MAELMGQHVRLRRVAALRTEVARQLVEETQVEVDLGVAWAIEGADGRGGVAAGRVDAAGERPHLDHLIVRRRTLPVVLDGVGVRDEPAVPLSLDVRASGALREGVCGGRALGVGRRAAEQGIGPDAEQQGHDEDDHAGPTAQGDLAATTATPAAHLRRVQVGLIVEPHRAPLFRRPSLPGARDPGAKHTHADRHGRLNWSRHGLIVGASNDIAEAIAVELASLGFHLSLRGRRSDRLAVTAQAVTDSGGQACVDLVDVTDLNQEIRLPPQRTPG